MPRVVSAIPPSLRRACAGPWPAVVGILALAACGSRTPPPAPAIAAPPSPSASAAPPTFTVAFLGDSLTAGLGLTADEAYPAAIGRRLRTDGYADVTILNAGISGDTTAGGLDRVDALLTPDVKVLVVALGGNDLLRGLSPTDTRGNLATIVRRAQDRGAGVLLAGLRAPTNLGADFDAAFENAFASIAHANRQNRRFVFVPFLLEGVAGVPSLNQADGIHPTAEGDRRVADHLYPTLRRLLDVVRASPPGSSR